MAQPGQILGPSAGRYRSTYQDHTQRAESNIAIATRHDREQITMALVSLKFAFPSSAKKAGYITAQSELL